MKDLGKRFSLILAILLIVQSVSVDGFFDATIGRSSAETVLGEYSTISEGAISANVISGGAIEINPPPEGDGIGLKGTYFIGTDFTGIYEQRTDAEINFNWRNEGPVTGIGDDHFSVIWEGVLKPNFSEKYTFKTETHGGVRLTIDESVIIDNLSAQSHITETGSLNLIKGEDYKVKIEYIEGNGGALAKFYWSSKSQEEEIVPQKQLNPPFVPEIPKEVRGTSGSKSVKLNWENVDGAETYEIRRDNIIIATTAQCLYIDTDLYPLTSYSYEVRAVVPGVVGQWSDKLLVTTRVEAPSNLSASYTEGKVELTWDAVQDVDAYELDIDGVESVVTESLGFLHNEAASSVEHQYRVRAIYNGQAGDWSDVFVYVTPSSIPTGLTAESGYEKIELSWNEVVDAISYEVEVDGLVYSASTTMYIHEGLVPNSVHSYRVRSNFESGVSNWSEKIVISTVREVGTGIGLRADYYSDEHLVNYVATQIDEKIEFDWKKESPAAGVDNDTFSVRWTGQVQALYSEKYTFYTRTHGGVKLWIDGELIIDDWSAHNTTHQYGSIELNAGERYDIQLEYKNSNGVAEALLSWSSETQVEEIVPRNLLYPIGVPNGFDYESDFTSTYLSWNSVTNASGYELEADGEVIDVGYETEFVHSDLIPGTLHEYRLRAYDDFSKGEWSEINSAVTKLGAVEELETVYSNETEISLSWSDVYGSTGYDIELDGKIILAGGHSSFVHDGLLTGTYHTYRVRAKTDYTVGPWSDYISSWTKPGIPGHVEAEATEHEIFITWDENVRGATGYDIEYDGQIFESVSMMFIYEDLEPGTEHRFRVRAKNSSGVGKWTDELVYWTLPDIPENINIDSYEERQIVSWDKVIGATGYDVEFFDAPIHVNTNSFVSENLEPNTQYAYRVRAKNSSGHGKWSEVRAKMTTPEAPKNFTVASESNFLKFMWEDIAGATQYEVEIDGTVVSAQSVNETVLENLESDTIHAIRVRSINNVGKSEWSELISGKTLLEEPSIIDVSQTDSDISVVWSSRIGYSYEIDVDGVIYEINSNSYIHTNLEPNSEHSYRVRSVTNDNVSQWTENLYVTTVLNQMDMPAGVAESTRISVEWNPVYGASSYDLEVDGSIVDMGESTFFVHENLDSNSTHTYRIRGLNSGGASAWSETLTLITRFSAPKNLEGHATSNKITLKWEDGTGAESYDVMIDGSIIEGVTSLQYIHDELKPNTWHVYRVRSRVGDMTSEWSESLALITMPATPAGIEFLESATSITMSWESVSGANSYEIKVDGEIKKNITALEFTLDDLEPNESYTFSIRSANEYGYSDWSPERTVWTSPIAPEILSAESTTNSIMVAWSEPQGAKGYLVQIDDLEPIEVKEAEYTFKGLDPNSWHTIRVKSISSSSQSSWSDPLEKNTEPEITVQIEKDREFNFVIVAPADSEKSERTIQVSYDPNALELIDLSAITPELELAVGEVTGTDITVIKIEDGYIEFSIKNTGKTIMNSIRFLKKTNDDSKIAYEVD